MFENTENGSSSAKSQRVGFQKAELKPLIRIEIIKQIPKCKLVADFVRENMDELVEVLVKCYEDAPENSLANYVWNFVKKESKIFEVKFLLVSIAEVLEETRQYIINTKNSDGNAGRLVEKQMQNRQKPTQQREVQNSPQKKLPYHGQSPVNRVPVPPKPMSNGVSHSLPRNFEKTSSSRQDNTLKKQVVRKSMFDDVSDDDDEDPAPASKRPRAIHFDEGTAVDNEHHPKEIDIHRGNTVAAALQPHETIDYEFKLNMEGPTPSQILTAFPNQRGLCRKPQPLVHEKWNATKLYDDDIKLTFLSFKNSIDDLEDSSQHLFIFDSMLSGIPFEKTYKKVSCIDCGYPNDPFNILRFLENEINEKRNDYLIKNVFICIGLDFLALDERRAQKLTIDFLQRFLNLIIRAFDPKKGPKRFNRTSSSFLNEKVFIDVIPPKLTFITIPQARGPSSSINMNIEIAKMNERIRLFVEKWKEAAEKKRLFMEIYDWEKTAAKFDQCNVDHLGKRNGIFMNYLSTEHAILMYRPDE
uniref:Uncharacterized protein n=1 Tax=Panagrolaimus sp. ES5 TaxID=591445 RepID=A0AC34GW54_9BILA